MAKLRKMLGRIDDPKVVSLMRLIETQNIATLARWSVDYAQEHFLAIYEKTYTEDVRLRSAVSASKDYLDGTITLKEVKSFLKGANQASKEVEESPAAQAAARAVAVACGAIRTPTNALGFTFYGAAAAAYDQAGLKEDQMVYDSLAAKEFGKILASLQSAAVPDEEDPVEINWNC